MEIKIITKSDTEIVKAFLSLAGKSLETFRYYNNRKVDAIKTHYVTFIGFENDVPIAYGHLDRDKDAAGIDEVWLGICVTESALGRGLGNQMMQSLTAWADKANLTTIKLTVDKRNVGAVNLYQKYGFIKTSEDDIKYWMSRSKH